MSLKCVVCGNPDLKKVNLVSREKEYLDLFKCTNCNHLFQDPSSFNDIYTTGKFTEIARDNQRTPSKEKIYSLDKKALERIRFYSKQLASDFDNILEIGSSIGSFVHHLKLIGKNVNGLEPDPYYAEFSKEQYGFSQYCNTIEHFKPGKKFDAVCSFHVLEHIQNLDEFFLKIKNILNLKGKVLLEMPSLDIHNYGLLDKTIWKPHIHYFTLSSLYFIVAKYFKVIDIGIKGESLYVFAEKSDNTEFNKETFKRLKRRFKKTYNILQYSPSIVYKGLNISQLILQPFFQKDLFTWLKKLVHFAIYGIKERFYVHKEKRFYNNNKTTHITYYRGWENTGDTVLSKCVRDVYNVNSKGLKWDLNKITHPVNSDLINRINSSKSMVLGGGGVLIPDTNKNAISGWQWAISKEQLNQIKVPIILYAIGYNYFPNQEPNEFFIDNLRHIVSKADFIGLRNHGSIRKVSELVGENLEAKLKFQPCPTTIIRKLYKNIPEKEKSKNIAVNIAYDRYEKRFGSDIYQILDQISSALKDLESRGYKIYNVCHLSADSRFELSLNKHQVNYSTVYLNYKLPFEVYKFYNNMELVMGMRGHAQMIPFGLNCKIISLGSHDKMRWFLEDIEATEWYLNIREDISNLKHNILEKTIGQLEDSEIIDEKLRVKQDYLLDITNTNIREIKGIISGK